MLVKLLSLPEKVYPAHLMAAVKAAFCTAGTGEEHPAGPSAAQRPAPALPAGCSAPGGAPAGAVQGAGAERAVGCPRRPSAG